MSIDITDLSSRAVIRGYTIAGIVDRLQEIIERNHDYVSRPSRAGCEFNRVIEEDNEVLALAVVRLQDSDARQATDES
jgi:hypothetical protein